MAEQAGAGVAGTEAVVAREVGGAVLGAVEAVMQRWRAWRARRGRRGGGGAAPSRRSWRTRSSRASRSAGRHAGERSTGSVLTTVRAAYRVGRKPRWRRTGALAEREDVVLHLHATRAQTSVRAQCVHAVRERARLSIPCMQTELKVKCLIPRLLQPLRGATRVASGVWAYSAGLSRALCPPDSKNAMEAKALSMGS